MNKENHLICFQDLWSVAVGQSAFQDVQLIEKELLDSVDALKKGLSYYKAHSESSIKQLKDDDNIHANLWKFLSQSSKLLRSSLLFFKKTVYDSFLCLILLTNVDHIKLTVKKQIKTFIQTEISWHLKSMKQDDLNVDGMQLYRLFQHFSSCSYRGSEEKLKQVLADQKLSNVLLGEISNYYFTERLYLLRILGQIIGFFQDQSYQYQGIYSKVMKHLSGVVILLEEQFRNSLDSKPPPSSAQGFHKTAESEIESRLALQRVKEQCEILELIFLHYSQYGMNTDKLYQLATWFQGCGFGREHPFIDVLPNDLIFPLLDCMNALQQVIIIEGFDFDLLQEPEDHQLSRNKDDFDKLDTLFYGLIDRPELSPLILAWSTVRYLLVEGHGGSITQKMGERAISSRVWHHVTRLLEHYPFNTQSNVSTTAKKVLRQLLSRVTATFHEETLGDYNDLVSLAVLVQSDSREPSLHMCGLDSLLFSAAGFFPLFVDPMLSLLCCMVKTKEDLLPAHAYVANLPIFSEYIATCTRDEVESLEDASVWRLLASKPIRSAGGLHTFRLPVGTIGNLVDSQFGAMVQWQRTVNGWKVLHAEVKNLIEYHGPSSNLELLGFLQKTELIYQLVESILIAAKDFTASDSSCLAVLETMELFISKFHQVIQRVVQSPNPPIPLITCCLRCANAWLKINPKQNCSQIVASLAQIHFLPSSERIGFSLAVFGRENQPGLYGMLLLKCEIANGCYIVTVATIDLLVTLLEFALERDAGMVRDLTPPVEFVLSEVFASYQQWQKKDNESWDKIGIRCLELCHLVLTTSVDDKESLPDTVLDLQKTVVEILSCSSVAKVILKLSCVDVLTLHAVMANEPHCPAVLRLGETIKLGFSLLNNLLRIESSLVPSNELEKRSYLHQTLATPTADSNTNLVSVVANYIYHRRNIALPKLAVALLRRIALVAPMSLYACLGTDVVATREILLFRLKSRTEDIALKTGILELYVATVQAQPGLLELFLDFEKANSEKSEHVQNSESLVLGRSSCLKVVLDMISPSNQGTYRLPSRLHCACVKLLNALWVDKRHSTLQAIRRSTAKDGLAFWSSVLYPLFSENSPKDIAQSELLETCAHIFNIIAHDFFFSSKETRDDALMKVLTEFKDRGRYEHWSKVLLCVTKTMIATPKFERRRYQMFASAWRSFVIVSEIVDPSLISAIVDDLCSAITFLVDEVDKCPDAVLILDLLSSLLLIILHELDKLDFYLDAATDLHPFLSRIVSCIEAINESPELARVFCHLQTSAIVLMQLLIRAEGNAEANLKAATDLIELTCKCLNLLLNIDPKKSSKPSELSLLLVRSLDVLFQVNDRTVRDLWLETLSRESTFCLLLSVIVKLFTSSRDNTEMIRLSLAILRLLSNISIDQECARKIYDTGLMPGLCLNLMCVCDPAAHKKWMEVYHMCLVLMTRMIVSLSYDFVEESLDFIGVHHERIFECLFAIRWKPTPAVLQEAILSTAFLSTLSRVYAHQWRFKLPRVYDDAQSVILNTTHVCVAMLLQPRLLLKTAKLQEKEENPLKVSSSTKLLSAKRSISKSLQEEDSSSPEKSVIQERLFYVLANCIEFLINLSPNLCQIMLDQGIDPDEYPQLLSINFSTPSLEQEPVASFGVIISAANLALTAMRKLDSDEEKTSSLGNALSLLSDSALVLVMSQCLLLLKQPNISNRQKQLLKRELSDELNSCVRSASRHLRHSSSSFSPHSSPIHSARQSSTSFGGKGILELVNAFIKQRMT